MARDPSMTLQAPDAVSEIDINSIPDFDIIDYNLADEKSYNKLLSRIEKCCRSSYEYRALINYLRNFAEMDKCSFMKYITNAESKEIRIEIHHEPITLYDIVSIVIILCMLCLLLFYLFKTYRKWVLLIPICGFLLFSLSVITFWGLV